MAPRRVPGARAALARAQRHGPRPVAGGHGITVVSTVPTLAALWPAEALENVRLLIFGGEACPPELGQRLAVRRPRGVEHLRPDRGDRRRVRGAARRQRPGAHRAAAATAGISRSSTRDGQPVADGRGRRAHHRRRRPGPLPRPGEGRREVRADAEPRLGPRLPQRRPGALRPGGPGLPGPRRRPGQGRRPAHRARRGRGGACRPCPVSRGAAAAVQRDRSRQPAAGRLRRQRRPRRSTDRRPRAALRGDAARRAGAAPGASSTSCPTRTSGKVDRAALPWPLPRRADGRDGPELDGTEALAAPSSGSPCSASAWPTRTPTSSTSAAARSRPRSWSSRIRERDPEFTVADVYDHPAARRDGRPPRAELIRATAAPTTTATSGRRRRIMQWVQIVAGVPLCILTGLRVDCSGC